MKKYWLLFGIIFLIIAFVFTPKDMFLQKNERVVAMNYYFPKDFKGCAMVFYNVANSPSLEFKDGNINYHFDNNGMLMTSSPEDFGWEGRKNSGFHKSNFYKGNQLMDYNEIVSHSLGEIKDPNLGNINYEQISIGIDACSEEYLDKILKKYIKK